MYSDWGIGLERKSDEMGNCGATGFRIFMWDDGDVYSEQLVDHTWSSIRCIEDRFQCILFEYRLCASCAIQLGSNIGMSFCFCHTFQVIIHDNPLAERFVDAQAQGAVELWQTRKKNNCPVFGIHFKVEQHF